VKALETKTGTGTGKLAPKGRGQKVKRHEHTHKQVKICDMLSLSSLLFELAEGVDECEEINDLDAGPDSTRSRRHKEKPALLIARPAGADPI
jgi:hypothetical protein